MTVSVYVTSTFVWWIEPKLNNEIVGTDFEKNKKLSGE